jgi:hypothetical protein
MSFGFAKPCLSENLIDDWGLGVKNANTVLTDGMTAHLHEKE